MVRDRSFFLHALCAEMHAEDHPKVANATGNLGTFAFRRGRLREAETLFRESLRLHLLRTDPDSAAVLLAKHKQRFAEAESIALDLMDRSMRLEGADGERTKRCRSLLAQLYDSWANPRKRRSGADVSPAARALTSVAVAFTILEIVNHGH